MNTKILLIVCFLLNIFIPNNLMAQDEEGVKLDLLKAPSSPAASLLKFATTDIEKPTDLSALMLSLQSASSSFSKLPSNYAIDIAPYWLFRTKTDFTTTGLNQTNYKDVFKQTFVLSVAVKNVDAAVDNFKPTSTYGALGFKFSIIRPQYSTSDLKILKSIHATQKELNLAVYKEVEEKSVEYQQLEKRYFEILEEIRKNFPTAQEAANELVRRQGDSNDEIFKNEKSRAELNQKKIDAVIKAKDKLIKKLATDSKEFGGKREGLSWDLAGGVGSEFRDKKFDNSKVHNAGIWTTVGFNGKKNFSFLMLARYLLNPEQEYEDKNTVLQTDNISTLDGGARVVYSTAKSKFNSSLECLYRQSFTSLKNDKTWRLVFNADYAIWQNQKLTFSFGRDFDGTISKGGNLITALTFLTGFGNKR